MFKRRRVADLEAEAKHRFCARKMAKYDSLPLEIRKFLWLDVHISLKRVIQIYVSCNLDVTHTLQELHRFARKKQENYEKALWDNGGRNLIITPWRKGKKKNAASTEDLLA